MGLFDKFKFNTPASKREIPLPVQGMHVIDEGKLQRQNEEPLFSKKELEEFPELGKTQEGGSH